MAPLATKAASAVTSASMVSVRYVGSEEVLLALLAGAGPTSRADLAFSELRPSLCHLTCETKPLCLTVSGNGDPAVSTILSVTTTLPFRLHQLPTAHPRVSVYTALVMKALGGFRQLPPRSLEGLGKVVWSAGL